MCRVLYLQYRLIMPKYSKQTWHTILASINCNLICQALKILTDTACFRLSSSQDSSPDISATLWLIKLYKISHFLLIESYLASLTQAFIMMSKCADPSLFSNMRIKYLTDALLILLFLHASLSWSSVSVNCIPSTLWTAYPYKVLLSDTQRLYIMSLRATEFVWRNVTDTKKDLRREE